MSAALTVAGVLSVWHVTLANHTGGDPAYTAFIPSIGAALLGAWFMRILSRQIISNLSLSSDADERVAMVKTYLALVQGGHAQEGDRGLILSSLFRTAARSSDDAAPPTIADALGRVLRTDK
jgi:hypothetical protein